MQPHSLAKLASSWADSICLTFSVGHTKPWADNKVRRLGPHWSENSQSECRPALKYLVLITATTFTLAGYCWNIIPEGLCSEGTTPLFHHTADGSHSLTQAFFFFLIWETGHTATASFVGWQRATENRGDERHFITLNYIAAKFWVSGAAYLSGGGWWIFELPIWLLALFTCLPSQPTAALMNAHTVPRADTEMI